MEYSLLCLRCQHGPHKDKNCSECDCTQFLRADIHAAYAVSNINNMLASELPKIYNGIGNLLDLLCMAFPEAVEKVMAARAAAQQQQKEENATPTADTLTSDNVIAGPPSALWPGGSGTSN